MQENMVQVYSRELVSASEKSHLPLRKSFHGKYLPPHDHDILLVDENEREYSVRYMAKLHKLQSGWRKFVQSNSLLEGDTVVFYHIRDSEWKFKVCIERENRSTGTNGEETRQSERATVLGLENPVLQSRGKESVPATSRKRSRVTCLNGPKGKIRKLNDMVKQDCGKILSMLMRHSSGWIFNKPVDPVKEGIPDYFSIITKPMDLGTIKKKLKENAYSRMEKFAADVRLTFSNAMLYNPSYHEVHKRANDLSGLFDKKWKSLEAKLNHNGTSSSKDDGQDLCQSTSESFQDSEKEKQTAVDGRGGKEINIESVHRSAEANSSDETMLVPDCDSTPLTDQSHGVKNSASGIMFKGFEDFKVLVNGETLDSELPPDVRMKYYKLCCRQNKLVHDRVLKGIGKTVVVGLIIEIVRIADAIKIADISISPEDLKSYEKTLNYCQAIDMAVESLQAKLCELIKFSKEYQSIDESTRVIVAEIEKERTALLESAAAREKLIRHLEDNLKAQEEEKQKLGSGFKDVAGSTL